MPWPSLGIEPSYGIYPGDIWLVSDRTLSPSALDLLELMPTWIREDPDVQGMTVAVANEAELIGIATAAVRDGAFPRQGTDFLWLWELMLGLSVDPDGVTTEQRQARVVARILRQSGPLGVAWIDSLLALVGSGFLYQEHEEGDPYGPPQGYVRVHVPMQLSDPQAGAVQNLLRQITQAHLGLEILWGAGFLLNINLLDADALS